MLTEKVSPLQDILRSPRAAAQTRRAQLIIAENVDGDTLAVCILKKLYGQRQVRTDKAPGFGDNRKRILGDLAILAGDTIFTGEPDVKLERTTLD